DGVEGGHEESGSGAGSVRGARVRVVPHDRQRGGGEERRERGESQGNLGAGSEGGGPQRQGHENAAEHADDESAGGGGVSDRGAQAVGGGQGNEGGGVRADRRGSADGRCERLPAVPRVRSLGRDRGEPG